MKREITIQNKMEEEKEVELEVRGRLDVNASKEEKERGDMGKRKKGNKEKQYKGKRKTGKRKASGLMKMNYTLSASLSAVCGTKSATRPEVVKKLWAYIKRHKLQDTKNRRMINPDKKLGAVLGNRQINMLKMAGAISKHLK